MAALFSAFTASWRLANVWILGAASLCASANAAGTDAANTDSAACNATASVDASIDVLVLSHFATFAALDLPAAASAVECGYVPFVPFTVDIFYSPLI